MPKWPVNKIGHLRPGAAPKCVPSYALRTTGVSRATQEVGVCRSMRVTCYAPRPAHDPTRRMAFFRRSPRSAAPGPLRSRSLQLASAHDEADSQMDARWRSRTALASIPLRYERTAADKPARWRSRTENRPGVYSWTRGPEAQGRRASGSDRRPSPQS